MSSPFTWTMSRGSMIEAHFKVRTHHRLHRNALSSKLLTTPYHHGDECPEDLKDTKRTNRLWFRFEGTKRRKNKKSAPDKVEKDA